jgi:hypothetical protein
VALHAKLTAGNADQDLVLDDERRGSTRGALARISILEFTGKESFPRVLILAEVYEYPFQSSLRDSITRFPSSTLAFSDRL